jgi:IS30 family transposase
VTLANRVSEKTLIAHVLSKHAEGLTAAIIKLLLPEKEQLHTITFVMAKSLPTTLK